MFKQGFICRLIVAASSMLLAVIVAAEQVSDKQKSQAAGANDGVISANEILSADVSNLLNPVGSVRDLVLTPDGKEVQYILYEIPYPYSFYGAEDGFVSYDHVELERGAYQSEFKVLLRGEESQQAPEQLQLTAGQADHRLVSRLVGEPLHFPGDVTREIQDILIDRDSGKLTSIIVEMNPDALFNDQPRAIPAENFTIDSQGRVSTTVELDSANSEEQFQLSAL